MNDLTPPVKPTASKSVSGEKVDAAPKAAKVAKVPKEPKPPKEPKEPKIAKPRGQYGYHVDSVIEINKTKEITYKGQRKEWFEILKGYDGKKVSEFNAATKGKVNGKGTAQTPSGWLRFFALDSTVKLHPPVVGTPAPVAPAA